VQITSRWLIVIVAAVTIAGGASGYRLLKKVPLPGTGSWDYVTVDQENRRVYISHETQVQVIDADSHAVIGTIPDTPGAHGVAIAAEFGRGFVSAGTANAVIVFDLPTLKIVGRVVTQKKPDSILYDPASKHVFAMNGESNSSTVINPADGKIEKVVDLFGGPEFSVADGKGNIYINLKDKNELERLDSKTLEVKDRWPTAPCTAPASLALDSANRRLFVGCRSKVMAVIDADMGKVIATYPVGDHVDATKYDPATKLVLNSTGDGNIAVFYQTTPDEYSLIETIPTSPGSKTMGLDLKTHALFVPANLAGQFTVLIYAKQADSTN
jgi:DNA-binding beta-propeller fold protein YncE